MMMMMMMMMMMTIVYISYCLIAVGQPFIKLMID